MDSLKMLSMPQLANPASLLKIVDKAISDWQDTLQKRAVKHWRTKVSLWSLQQRNAFDFVRNTSAPKVTALSHNDVLAVHPDTFSLPCLNSGGVLSLGKLLPALNVHVMRSWTDTPFYCHMSRLISM